MNANEAYTLPTEIHSEMQVKGFPLAIILSGLAFFFVSQRMENFIYTPLQIAWQIYNACVGIILFLPSSRNKGKRMISSILLFLTRDDSTYKPIPNPKEYSEMRLCEIDEEETNEEYY